MDTDKLILEDAYALSAEDLTVYENLQAQRFAGLALPTSQS